MFMDMSTHQKTDTMKISDLYPLIDPTMKGTSKYIEKVVTSHGLEPENDAIIFWAQVRDVKGFLSAEKMPAPWPSPRTLNWTCGGLIRLARNAVVTEELTNDWGSDAVDTMVHELQVEWDSIKAALKRRRKTGSDDEETIEELKTQFERMVGSKCVSSSAVEQVAIEAVSLLSKHDTGAYRRALTTLAKGLDPEISGLVLSLLAL
jgi:hypothetical protein